MLYALDNTKTEKIRAKKGLKGYCSFCGKELNAKCGKLRIHHWSHKPEEEEHCDSWRKDETQWHLDWKLKFPEKNCEVILEFNSEKHRADIFTDKGTVIEIQGSSISTEDIIKREKFYKEMIWVVNAKEIEEHFSFYTRRKMFIDNETFDLLKNYKTFTRIEKKEDWKKNDRTDELEPYENPVYCIRFDRIPHEKIRNLLKGNNFYWDKIEWKGKRNQYNYMIIKSLFDKKKYIEFVWKWARETWQYAKCPIFIDLGGTKLFEIVEGKGYRKGIGHFIDKELFIQEHKH